MMLDENKHVIISLLDELRQYNYSIGSYDKSMFTDSFEYSVKLSNGLIRLPMELVDDYEKLPSLIKPDRFKSAALNFSPSNPVNSSPPPIAVSLSPKRIKENSYNTLLKVLIAVVIIIAIIFFVKQAQNSEIRNNIRSYVAASSSSYNYRLIGGISNLKITVTNTSSYTLDNVMVRVAYIKQDGGVYKYEGLDFNNISPNSNMTINAPDSDRGTNIRYEIEKISCNQLGL